MLLSTLLTSYLLIRSSKVQTFIIQKITTQLSRKSNANIQIGKVEISFFNKVILNDFLIEGLSNDTIFYTKWVSAKIDTLKFRDQKINIKELTLEDNRIFISRDTANLLNFSFILDSLKTETETDTFSFWKIKCSQFNFKHSEVVFKDLASNRNKLISLHEMNLDISKFKNYGDSLNFQINNFNLNDGKNLFLDQLSAEVKATNEKIEFKSLNLKSKRSEINDLNVSIELGEEKEKRWENLNLDIQLSKSKISFSEIASLFPALKGMSQNVELSGRIYGSLSDLKGKDLEIKTGRNSNAKFDFYINGIENRETMYLFFDLKKLETTFDDVSNFKFPRNLGINNIEFPEILHQAGILRFNGNFSGFLSDFVTFGTLESDMGTIKTDATVIPKENGKFQYRGTLSTTDFQLGELLKTNTIGNLTFNGEVDGNFINSNNSIEGFFKGDIAEIDVNKYVYKNIKLDGIYIDKMFDGMLSMNDSNLQFSFLGRMDLSSNSPEFDFNLELNKAHLGNLNLGKKFPKAEIALNMKAKFTGNKIDNLKGLILVDDGFYKNRNGEFKLDGIQLISVPNDTSMELSFSSDYFDLKVDGKYQFQSIIYDLKRNVDAYLPSFNIETPESKNQNIFDYRINVKELDGLTATFMPDFKFETPFFLYGKMNSGLAEFNLEGSLPGFQYKDIWFRNIFIGNKVIDNHYSSKFKFGEILHKNGISIYDFTINSSVANDSLMNEIEWYNFEDFTGKSHFRTHTMFSESQNSFIPKTFIEILPSQVFLTDTVWQIDRFNVTIDTTSIKIFDFNMHNRNQSVVVDGNISKDSLNMLSVDFNSIQLKYLNRSGKKDNGLNGVANCSIGISDIYDQPVVLADMLIDSLYFKEQLIGNVKLLSNWDQTNSTINSDLEIIKDNRKSLLANGFYKPKTREVNYLLSADSLPLNLLETVILNQFSDFSGTASGDVKMGGTLDKFTMDGAVKASNGAIKIDYTQVDYFLEDTIYLKTDTILFDNIFIFDKHNNEGKLNGTLVHDNFKNMVYDIQINSPRILALNTTLKSNDQFFGDIYANCKLEVKGKANTVTLDGSATTLQGTNVNISMEYESDIAQYDFLEFVNSDEIDEREIFFESKEKSEFNLSLDIEATPEAKVQLIYNSQIGDIIKAQGEGILFFEMDLDGDISLSGNYSVVKGDYLFTLQNILNKRFEIAQGGSIVWSGDPYNALIDISAIYNLKASLSDLPNDYFGTQDYLSQRIPVECIINLTEELINPTIDFEINFPDEKEGIKDRLQQFFNTEDEKNRQILSLIVMGKFYTPEYMRGRYETQNPNMIGTTASELFSNQLSNWLSQINNNVDVGFNYRPGNSLTDDEVELALSTQIFNDRVTLDGNIGNNVNPESNSSSQIVGDVDVRVKLTPNGKIQFKAFNHSNNDLIYETAPYTQGIGLSFKEEYNTVKELMQKVGSLFKKKEKRPI